MVRDLETELELLDKQNEELNLLNQIVAENNLHTE